MVTDKFEIKYGDESKMLAHLNSSDNQKPEAKIKIILYLIKFYCKSSEVSIEILQDEFKPIVKEKCEIEY